MSASVGAAVSETVFPYARWSQRLGELAEKFSNADPFPHIVLDDFVVPEIAAACRREFPPLEGNGWIHYTHFNERKFGKSDRETFPPALAAVVDEFNSPRFLRFLETLTGIAGLLPDDELMGAGLHQSTSGGFLNIHADFTGHPHRASWRRRLNLLLYLNDDWDDAYGGLLEFWDASVQRCVRRIPMHRNRAVIFRTDPTSFHGYPEPLRCPPGITRKSLALYYFTEEKAPFLVRSTEYRARPGDGMRAAGIYVDKMAVRLFDLMKRRLGVSDKVGSAVLKLLWRR